MAKYTKSVLDKFIQLYGELGYKVRFEKGTFKSGYCVLEDRNIVVINRFFDVTGKVQTMIDLLGRISMNEEDLSEASVKLLKAHRPPQTVS